MNATLKRALDAASDFFGRKLTKDMIETGPRTREYTQYRRFIAIHLRASGLTLKRIATLIGRTDHTTVMGLLRSVPIEWLDDPIYKAMIARSESRYGQHRRVTCAEIDLIGMRNLDAAMSWGMAA